MLKCLECAGELFGRIDKKFCSSQCRTAYHNRRNSDTNNFMRNVNNILRKNRRILFQMNPDGSSIVTKKQLLDKGFRFSYFTNEYSTDGGKIYKFCYDQGFIENEPYSYTLVTKTAYIH